MKRYRHKARVAGVNGRFRGPTVTVPAVKDDIGVPAPECHDPIIGVPVESLSPLPEPMKRLAREALAVGKDHGESRPSVTKEPDSRSKPGKC